MNPKIKILIGILIVLILLIGGWWLLNNRKAAAEKCSLEKITFDLGKIDDDGLVGLPSGKVSLDYEFCIAEDRYLQEINDIDPDIKCYPTSKGRIGCVNAEFLCVGNTGFKDFKSVLCKLSALDYVDRIDETFWE